jgi:hypothetical protein
MSTKPCQYISSSSSGRCRCPTFVPRINSGSVANLCDGCVHSIAWHSLKTNLAKDTTSEKLDDIISTYTMEAAASSSASSSKVKLKASETDARREAISGLRRTYESDGDRSKVIHDLLGSCFGNIDIKVRSNRLCIRRERALRRDQESGRSQLSHRCDRLLSFHMDLM